MAAVLPHHELFPDQVELLGREWFKVGGPFSLNAPNDPDVTHAIVAMVGAGGQQTTVGGNAAFATRKFTVVQNEMLLLQVGSTGANNASGDSWLKRATTGEVICYADRGRENGVPGNAAYCIGWFCESGQPARAGADIGQLQQLGLGGRLGANTPTRGAGPGGGGLGAAEGFPNICSPGGPGYICVEFYAGDPGHNGTGITKYLDPAPPPGPVTPPPPLAVNAFVTHYVGYIEGQSVTRYVGDAPAMWYGHPFECIPTGGSGAYTATFRVLPGSTPEIAGVTGAGFYQFIPQWSGDHTVFTLYVYHPAAADGALGGSDPVTVGCTIEVTISDGFTSITKTFIQLLNRFALPDG